MPVSRRTVLRGGVLGGLAAVHLDTLAHAAPCEAGGRPGEAPGSPGGTVVRHATNAALSYHPGSRRVVFDAVNALWLLPLDGGEARRLTDDAEDATWPSFFPDGRRVAFQSFREGSYDLCTVDLSSRKVRRLTTGPQYDLDPAVSPDGGSIAYVSDEGGTSAVRLLDLATGRSRPLVGGDDERAYRSPTWHPDGDRLAYVADGALEVLRLGSGEREVLTSVPEGQGLYAASYGPDGRLAHVVVDWPTAELRIDGRTVTDPAEEPAPLPAAWVSPDEVVYPGDGGLWRLRLDDGTRTAIGFTAALAAPGLRPEVRRPVDAPLGAPVQGMAGPVISPDGSTVCFRALGALWLWRFGGRPTRIVDDGYSAEDPVWFPDGRSLAYTSDRGGVPDLWRHDLATGTDHRLTERTLGAFLPSVSPCGGKLAFQDEAGATHVLDIAEGSERQVADAAFHPGRASWSPDGRRIAMAVTVPGSQRDENGLNEIRVVEVDSGTTRTEPVAPHTSIGTRGDDGPVWTPDGSAFVVVVDSLVHSVPIDGEGRITGPPAVVSRKVADAVSVSAAGHLMFLSLGTLVVGPLRTPARVREHRSPLVCHRRTPPPRTVVRAGRLWDGTSDGYRTNVDITIEDGRVRAVDDARPGGPPPSLDASDRTVLPGLIDLHNHWHFRGRHWAGRQGPLWLAYGVTTSRSTGDPVYRMAETREAIASGAAVGPRFLGSGEALDGTRCYYHFMRPVSSRQQLDREMERVIALRYNVVKSYQRLPVTLERRLVGRMRREGTPVVSHYLYPAVATGLNGMEHTGGGNRLGYSRTLGFSAGRTAEDTVRILADSGMWVSSTLLFANELFLDSTDLVEDRRTRVLFPEWEYRRLWDKVRQAEGRGNALNQAWTENDVDLLLRVHRAGGTVVAGTDAPLDDIGIGIHQNLRALVKYGFTPVDALRTATGNAAAALGARGALGVVAPGARADLVVVEGDPLRRVADAARVEHVLVDGHIHHVPELLEPYARTAAPGGIRPEPAARATGSGRGPSCCRTGPASAHHR